MESVLARERYEVQVCSDAHTARRIADEMDPDLALLDVNLGSGPSGIQLGFVLEQTHPGMVIAYLTRYPTALLNGGGNDDHLAGKMVLAKDDITDADALVSAVEAALKGEPDPIEVKADAQVSRLTATQIEILSMLASGMTNSAIAQRRSTSERAVEKQVKLIYETLGLESDKATNARVLAARRFIESMGEVAHDDAAELEPIEEGGLPA